MALYQKFYYVLWVLSTAVAGVMIHNILMHSNKTDPLFTAVICISVALFIIGFLVNLLIKKSWIHGISAFFMGVVAILSGFISLGALPAPSPQIFSTVTIFSLLSGIILWALWFVLGVVAILKSITLHQNQSNSSAINSK